MRTNPLNKILLFDAVASCVLSGGLASPLPFGVVWKKPKTKKKCFLPECQKETTHNGGYCCAQHCQMHRYKMKHGIETPAIL